MQSLFSSGPFLAGGDVAISHLYCSLAFSFPLHVALDWPHSSVPTDTRQVSGELLGLGWKGLGISTAR